MGFTRTGHFSVDGCRLLSAGADGTAWVWDPATGEQRAVMSGHWGEFEDLFIQTVRFAPDETLVASVQALLKSAEAIVDRAFTSSQRESTQMKRL